MKHRAIRFRAGDTDVHGIRTFGTGVRARLVLAHGAGAGMSHPFMLGMAERLARRDVAVLRYDFPYMREGRRLPDRAPRLLPVVRAAVEVERGEGGDAPIWAGGKSMGGRMTSMAEDEAPLGVDGIVFLGFPLHPARKPSTTRAEHLERTRVPLRFVAGTRDALATPELLEGVLDRLGPRAARHVIEDADHAFRVPRRTGRSDDEVLDEIADAVAGWIA
jgi:predicted alpha/beta-hydrolase family hydrolase